LLQSWPPPHITVLGAFSVPSIQIGAPVMQVMTPSLQTFGLVLHPAPSVHATQLPAELHTMFAPHIAPGDLFEAESSQVCAPVAHEVTPTLHPDGLVAHG